MSTEGRRIEKSQWKGPGGLDAAWAEVTGSEDELGPITEEEASGLGDFCDGAGFSKIQRHAAYLMIFGFLTDDASHICRLAGGDEKDTDGLIARIEDNELAGQYNTWVADEHGDLTFVMDVMTATGEVERSGGKYRLAETTQIKGGGGRRTRRHRRAARAHIRKHGPTRLSELSERCKIPLGSISAVLACEWFRRTARGWDVA